MLEKLKDEFTRRRALYIAPFAFAGLWAFSSSRGDPPAGQGDAEITLIDFDNSGRRLGPARRKRVVRTESEWRSQLTLSQFYVARQGSTDTPYTGTFYKMHDAGLFRCVCCDTPLFDSETKFDSGTGWPSFWEPLAPENIRTRKDTSMFLERVEVTCALCDAHLGHVFQDGPPPTGLRYCLNESALRFVKRA